MREPFSAFLRNYEITYEIKLLMNLKFIKISNWSIPKELIKTFFLFPMQSVTKLKFIFLYSQQRCEIRGRRIFPRAFQSGCFILSLLYSSTERMRRSKKAKGNWRKNLTCLFNLVKRLRCSRISMIHDIALPSLFFISSRFLLAYCWILVYATMECSWAAFESWDFSNYILRLFFSQLCDNNFSLFFCD